MTDHDNLAAGLIFGGLDPAEEAEAQSLLQDPDFSSLVAEYAETAAFLAESDLPEPPSAQISERILAIPEAAQPGHTPHSYDERDEYAPASETTAPAAAVLSLDEHRRNVSRWKRTALTISGVGVAAAVGFGVIVIGLVNERGELQDEVTAVQSEVSDLNRLMLASDLSIGEAALPGDETATITVMASVDESLVRVQTSNVTIPDGQDMQMWLISDSGAEPMGLIDTANPGVESLPIPAGAELGFTMEPAGGSDELEGPPVVSIKF